MPNASDVVIVQRNKHVSGIHTLAFVSLQLEITPLAYRMQGVKAALALSKTNGAFGLAVLLMA